MEGKEYEYRVFDLKCFFSIFEERYILSLYTKVLSSKAYKRFVDGHVSVCVGWRIHLTHNMKILRFDSHPACDPP